MVMKNPRKGTRPGEGFNLTGAQYDDYTHHDLQLSPVPPEGFDPDLDDDTRKDIKSIRSVDDPSYSVMADELYSTMTGKDPESIFGATDDYTSSKELYDKVGGRFAGSSDYFNDLAAIYNKYIQVLIYDPDGSPLEDELSTSIVDTVYDGITQDIYKAMFHKEGMRLQKIITDVQKYIHQNPDGSPTLHDEAKMMIKDLKALHQKHFKGVGKRKYRRHTTFR